MKFLQQATLAAAIAAAPFAAQALQPMADADLGGVTGQSGVTIEIDLASGIGNDSAVKIGEVAYTDQGSVSIEGIKVGSAAGATITQTIDVATNGTLKMTTTGTGLRVGVDSVKLVDNTTPATPVKSEALASAINLNVVLGSSTTDIGTNKNLGNSGSNLVANSQANGLTDTTTMIKSSTSVELTSAGTGLTGTDSGLQALGGNVKVGGLAFYGNNGVDGDANVKGKKAVIDQTIWADNRGVNIKVEKIAGTLEIGSLVLGNNNNSIGSIKVSDIQMAGVTQRIYGHN